MSEAVQQAENAPETPQEPAQEAEQPKTYDEAYVAKLREEAAKYRTKLREEEQARRASMTEAERAIAEAEERGRQTATATYGSMLVRSEYLAAAAQRNPGFDVTGALEDLNLTKFIGEDGLPDSKAIATSVARLVPAVEEQAPTVPSFDGGVRTSHTPNSTASQFAKALGPLLP